MEPDKVSNSKSNDNEWRGPTHGETNVGQALTLPVRGQTNTPCTCDP